MDTLGVNVLSLVAVPEGLTSEDDVPGWAPMYAIDGVPLPNLVPDGVLGGATLTVFDGSGSLAPPDPVRVMLREARYDSSDLGERVPVLVCGSCGDLNCGALLAHARIGGTVTWDRLEWDNFAGGLHVMVPELPAVEFTRENYELVLQQALVFNRGRSFGG